MSRRKRGSLTTNQEIVDSNTDEVTCQEASHSSVQVEKAETSCHEEDGNDHASIGQDMNEAFEFE